MVANKKTTDLNYQNNPKLNAEPDPATNPDPITGEAGSHPVGVGLGAAGGAYAGAVGGAFAGAAGGAAVGPAGIAAGAVIGAIAGGIAGGYAGKGVAELVNPSEIETYYSENFAERPYVLEDASYESYKPAYNYGYEARVKTPAKNFNEVESTLRSDWEKSPTNANLGWDKAKPAIQDSYEYTDTLYKNKLNDKK